MDAIIHLVGIIREFGQSTFENIHVHGTENVIKAAREHGAVRDIHMSALGTRADATSRYHKSKYAAEELVRQSGLNYTIFRPSLIFGPRDEFVNLFAKIARLSPIFPMMNYNQARFSPVSVEVVGRAFTAALTEPRSSGKTFDLCGMDTFEMPELLDRIFTVLGRKRLKVHIPFAVAKAQARVLEFVYLNLLRKPSPFSRDQLIMLCEDNTGDPNPANDLFRLPQIGFEEGIARYLKAKR